MEVSATTLAPVNAGADTIVVGLLGDEGVAHDTPGGELSALVDAGEARSRFKHLAVTHAEGHRWILVGLGPRDEFSAERMRHAAAVVVPRAREIAPTRPWRLCWELPHKVADDVAGAVVEGTLLAAYRFTAFKRPPEDEPPELDALIVSAHHDVAGPVGEAATVAAAVNAARELQNRPANDLSPEALAARARELPGVTVEVEGREGIEARGMGAFAAVAAGSDREPALITLRYEGPDATGPVLGLVGKGVTFDTGGISIKPAARMADMKMDMSGASAVIEAIGAIAALELPVRVVGVVGATENMPSGHAMRPGDIVRAADGTSIEINNTDAEGRLVLCDCLLHARELGAERLVDVATLTGAILVALGNTHAGLFASDDAWADTVAAAAAATGELTWRLPLHPEYAKLIEGRFGDIVNATDHRKAGSITAAEFLRRFAGDVPWAHLDIAGTAWDLGRPYVGKGASGFGVRLLVELARRVGEGGRDHLHE